MIEQCNGLLIGVDNINVGVGFRTRVDSQGITGFQSLIGLRLDETVSGFDLNPDFGFNQVLGISRENDGPCAEG
jgi:hypothetical protein